MWYSVCAIGDFGLQVIKSLSKDGLINQILTVKAIVKKVI